MPKSARHPCAANWAFPLLVWLVYLQVPEVFVDASGMVNMPTVKNGQAFDGNAELRMAYATTTFGDDSAPNTFAHQLGRTLYFSMKSFPIFLPLLHLRVTPTHPTPISKFGTSEPPLDQDPSDPSKAPKYPHGS